MAIESAFTVEYTPWGGAGGEFPIAFWFREGTRTGDASGGAQTVRLQFTTSADTTRDSKLYSLEQYWVSQTGLSVSTKAVIQVRNMGLTPPQSDLGVSKLNQTYSVDLPPGIIAPSTVTNAGRLLDRVGTGLFLGSMIDIGAANGTGVEMHVDNVINGSMTFGAMGFVWDTTARSVVGGPKRPPGSIFAR